MQIFFNTGEGEIMTYDEYLQALRQQVMHDLQGCHGFAPVFRDDIESTEDCGEESENLPLVYIWIERLSDDQGRCVLSINRSFIAVAIAAYISRDDEAFDYLLDTIASDLSSMCTGAFKHTMQHFGFTPEQACSALATLLDRQ